MNAITKLSVKGQVVIPKDVRDRMGLVAGDVLDIVEFGDEVLLRRRNPSALFAREAVAQSVKDVRKIFKYDGPRVSEEDIENAVIAALASKYSGDGSDL